MSSPVLILPGIGNSGPLHWQSLWEQANPAFIRVEQRDWDHPVCEEWVATLAAAVRQTGPDVVLVAHSLACLALAQWASRDHAPIAAALLVAVPDPAGPNFPAEAVGFSQTPTQPFDFRSIVVASTDDPYGSVEHALGLAQVWGSRWVSVGACGHINASSGLGAWAEGYELFTQLRG